MNATDRFAEALYLGGAKLTRHSCKRVAAAVLARSDWTVEDLRDYLYLNGATPNKASALLTAERYLRVRNQRVVKVTLAVVVDVDLDAYEREYGEPATPAQVREDFAQRVRDAAAESFRPFDWATVEGATE